MANKRVAILGCTGSIGRQTLDVIRQQSGLEVCALAAGANWQLLARQAAEFRPPLVALSQTALADQLKPLLPAGTHLLAGPDAMTDLVRRSNPDILLTAVVGSAGLAPTLAGIECGADLAIANKETLVMAGELVIPLARKAGVAILPVDSEHSAIFQCLRAGQSREVRHVVITASGGALRNWDPDKVATATVADALNHPTWQMGRKITIDSATLINKALEMIEAHWLFDLGAERIKVLLHAESIIHSYVEYCDGSVIAQLGEPDMMLPIAYALNYPDRVQRDVPPLDLAARGKLSFRPLSARFARAVELGYQVIRRGGTSGAVMNAANEAAVAAFLDGRILFGQIVPLVEEIMNQAPPSPTITLQTLLHADAWARQQVARRVDKVNT